MRVDHTAAHTRGPATRTRGLTPPEEKTLTVRLEKPARVQLLSVYSDHMPKYPSVLKSTASQSIYARVVAEARKLGPFEVEEKKTSLHLTNGRAFAGIHPRATGIILNLVLDAPVKNTRVHKSERVSANRHHVEFKLESPTEVDAQLVGWMKKAYSMAANTSRHRLGT